MWCFRLKKKKKISECVQFLHNSRANTLIYNENNLKIFWWMYSVVNAAIQSMWSHRDSRVSQMHRSQNVLNLLSEHCRCVIQDRVKCLSLSLTHTIILRGDEVARDSRNKEGISGGKLWRWEIEMKIQYKTWKPFLISQTGLLKSVWGY